MPPLVIGQPRFVFHSISVSRTMCLGSHADLILMFSFKRPITEGGHGRNHGTDI